MSQNTLPSVDPLAVADKCTLGGRGSPPARSRYAGHARAHFRGTIRECLKGTIPHYVFHAGVVRLLRPHSGQCRFHLLEDATCLRRSIPAPALGKACNFVLLPLYPAFLIDDV